MPQLQTTIDKRSFYRQTFEIKNNGVSVYRHTLLINPEDMSIDEPHRATVTQTMGGAYVSLFGEGLKTVNLSGKTGYHARRNADGILTDGYEEIKRLRNFLYRGFIMMPQETNQMEMFWYNWEDEEYYKVIPMSMRIQRNTSLGLMYRYDLQLICVEQLLGRQDKPNPDNLLSAVEALEYGMTLSYASSSLSETMTAFTGGGA